MQELAGEDRAQELVIGHLVCASELVLEQDELD